MSYGDFYFISTSIGKLGRKRKKSSQIALLLRNFTIFVS